MVSLRALPALAALLACSGCGYIHFGRLPESATVTGDAQLATAYSDLRTEHKILQQELALTRREGDALRAALDRNSPGAPDLAARLQETTRELAALRATYAKLSEAKPAVASAKAGSATDVELKSLEEKLAASLRNYTQLQEENARLRADVTRTRAENTTLSTQLKSAAAQNSQAQAALAQLNTELLAQKEARARADQQAEAARAQLSVVVARVSDSTPTLADSRESSATGATAIAAPVRVANAPASDAPPTAELRTSPERLKAASEARAKSAQRVHVVQAGDTLETIAQKYYGAADKWMRVYMANSSQLSGGRPIKPGMELEIPDQ